MRLASKWKRGARERTMCLQLRTLARLGWHRLRTIKTEETGAELVEAALIIPLLLTFLVGIVSVGRGFNVYQTITRAAREGAKSLVLTTCATCGNTPVSAAEAQCDLLVSGRGVHGEDNVSPIEDPGEVGLASFAHDQNRGDGRRAGRGRSDYSSVVNFSGRNRFRWARFQRVPNDHPCCARRSKILGVDHLCDVREHPCQRGGSAVNCSWISPSLAPI